MESTLPKLNAKSLLLDLLRMVQPMALPVSLLVNAGRVLGINENSLRVNITRLTAKAQIEQDERGLYRLGKESAPHDLWLRQWQRGEARVKAWKGDFLVLNISSVLKTKEQQSIFKLASYFGFRELLPSVWLRPNNLVKTTDELTQQIAKLSHSDAFVLIESAYIAQANKNVDLQALWNTEALENEYREIIASLSAGIEAAKMLSVEEAFKTSYFIGAEVHHRLALDPLLPKALVDVNLRDQVVKKFAAYDAAYRSAWIEFFQGHILKVSSRSLNTKLLASA